MKNKLSYKTKPIKRRELKEEIKKLLLRYSPISGINTTEKQYENIAGSLAWYIQNIPDISETQLTIYIFYIFNIELEPEAGKDNFFNMKSPVFDIVEYANRYKEIAVGILEVRNSLLPRKKSKG